MRVYGIDLAFCWLLSQRSDGRLFSSNSSSRSLGPSTSLLCAFIRSLGIHILVTHLGAQQISLAFLKVYAHWCAMPRKPKFQHPLRVVRQIARLSQPGLGKI